uniref:ARAD1D11660p n=1 Tax=Blastobotrys adeninivorans TaxID=409370 RepID=A0A060TE04_BLAAD
MKIIVFGATGGVCLNAVKLLVNEHKVVVAVRSKDKFTKLFGADVPESLEITEGDALDPDFVRATVQGSDIVLTGVGMALEGLGLTGVTFSGQGICENSMSILVDAVGKLAQQDRPKRLIVVSSTGLDDKRDYPLLLVPLYKLVLHTPHEDKRKMEHIMEIQTVFPEVISVRGAVYTDGDLTGKYRVGEDVTGYTISRADVGHFVATECVGSDKWVNKKPRVAY